MKQLHSNPMITEQKKIWAETFLKNYYKLQALKTLKEMNQEPRTIQAIVKESEESQAAERKREEEPEDRDLKPSESIIDQVERNNVMNLVKRRLPLAMKRPKVATHNQLR